jgi:hypothetical protein
MIIENKTGRPIKIQVEVEPGFDVPAGGSVEVLLKIVKITIGE